MKTLALALLFTSFLLLGCTQPSPTPTATPPAGGAQATPGATTTAAATATAQVGVQGGSELPTTVLAAIALGVPYKCRVSVHDRQTGSTESGDMWIKGQNYRYEATATGQAVTMVKRGDDVFMWIPDQSVWLKFSGKVAEPTGGPGAPEAPTRSTEDLEQATNIQCAPEVFGDEKFATPGTVKSMDEYLQAIQQQYGGGAAPTGVPTGYPSGYPYGG